MWTRGSREVKSVILWQSRNRGPWPLHPMLFPPIPLWRRPLPAPQAVRNFSMLLTRRWLTHFSWISKGDRSTVTHYQMISLGFPRPENTATQGQSIQTGEPKHWPQPPNTPSTRGDWWWGLYVGHGCFGNPVPDTVLCFPTGLSPPPNGKLTHRWNKPPKTRTALQEACFASGEFSPICHQYQG